MKSLINSFIALILFSPVCTAQNFVQFGQLSQQEIAMQQCSFDTDADAIVLLHEAHSGYSEDYHLITKHHVRIKILKEKGVEENANVSIHYWRNGGFEKIYVSKAATINVDAAGKPVAGYIDRKSIFDKKINEKIGEVSFAFPGVKVGSILEYEYESDMQHYGGLEDWYFQEERPVLSSRYTLVIVPNAEFAYQVVKRVDFNAVVKPDESNNSVYFEMNNIPGLRNEPYMDARKDYLQKVWIQLSRYRIGDSFGGTKYMTSWDEVNRELNTSESFGRFIGKSVPGTDTFTQRMKLIPGEVQRIKSIFEYVRGRMQWNNMLGIYLNDGFKDAWAKRTGSCAEINMILLNILKECGLDVSPALVSRRSHGKVDVSYPFIGQFHAMVARVIAGGHIYYLDATDEYTPFNMVPDELLNTTAFVLGRKKGELVTIADESTIYNERLLIEAAIDADAAFNGKVQVSSEGYARVEKQEKILVKGESGLLKEYGKNDKLQILTGNFRLEDKDSDSLPLLQHFRFDTRLIDNSGYYLLPVNLFSGLNNNPFTNDNRFSNINFGYRRSLLAVVKIAIPDNFDVDELPKAIRMVTPEKDIEMSRVIEYNKEEKQLSALVKVNFNKSYYPVDDYPVLQEFYKKMIDFLNEPVVLKKK